MKRWKASLVLTLVAAAVLAVGSSPVVASTPDDTRATSTSSSSTSYVPISGAGSSWSANAIDQWRRNVQQFGMRVNYASTGSSDGRNQFRTGTVDFASSEIPYGLSDSGVVDTPPSRKFAYMPIVAGGTSLMYNLTVGSQRITNLRLSGETVARIFTGDITSWDDAAIKADNPGITLPARRIVPVVRSDGSGTTAQLTAWMASEHPRIWDAYCARAGRPTPCGQTSNFPVISGTGFVGQPGSQGVSGYVAQRANVGTITYVEYSYAIKTGYPVAKLLNKAGYYVEPTASNVAVSLLGARINNDPSSQAYLTQILTGVYRNADPRTYPLSSYSYLIVPTAVEGNFTTAKGSTLGAFAYYFLCEGQRQAETLGYSPLPINLVKAGLEQVRKIPGVQAQSIDIRSCKNPTFSSDGTNTLAKNAPMPPECDRRGSTVQCSDGTGGAAEQPTQPGPGASDGGATDGSGTGTDTGVDGLPVDGGGIGGDGGATGGGPAICEIDTGACQTVAAIPVEIERVDAGWTRESTYMALALIAVLLTALAPPALARWVRATRSGS
ncbi:phosphate ABC transporter substrate-binding protein PstS [Microcella frigidaquae]|uniref:Phosphate ABC transporter phosphate-binding protein n=1 Tax=Microcella frigidaquae TaxID=424758 RepID=A0A840XGP8_9MICO|nr:phosphate ABC transporter substrate-binding protein PstS [Microcella frigidaquae]MBB5617486.1 phosphate ABC transporter phosphate-binding protein [Microcella frigidaquae]MCA1941987.1 phosphate ABC transporter substrate-binding protein PstS [Microcella sp.]NHN45355.1 phosphate ABC transporter substrate-binding protein PstS [Microcella frigidaquae]